MLVRCHGRYKLPGHAGCVNEVDFHPFEPIIASASSDKKVSKAEASAFLTGREQIYLGELEPT